MPSTIDIHNKLLQSAASNTQSTHGIAAQGTAARLLLLLQARGSETSKIEIGVQAGLVAYMDGVIAALTEVTEKAMPSVEALASSSLLQHPVILLGQAMLGLSDNALLPSPVRKQSAKQVIFNQLKKIVSNHPGAIWTDEDAKWSTNHYFDTETNSPKTLMVSPAQTLNLVCAAMLNRGHHRLELTPAMVVASNEAGVSASSSSSSRGAASSHSSSSDAASSSSSSNHIMWSSSQREDAAWLDAQARVLAQTLVRIAKEQTETELEKCSGGYQHDLLWMLEGSYLDEDRAPFVFVGDFNGFLLQQLYVYIETCLASRTGTARLRFYQRWLDWSLGASVDISPVMGILSEGLRVGFAPSSSSSNQASAEPRVDAGWKGACCEFLRVCCDKMAIVLDSWGEGQIKAYVELLPTLEFSGEHVRLTLANELLRIQSVDASRVAFAHELVVLRNVAISVAQRQFQVLSLDEIEVHRGSLSQVLSAEAYFQSLLRYGNMMLIGGQDHAFGEARVALLRVLCEYFRDYQWGCLLPDAWSSTIEAYGREERVFKAQPHIDIVTNFLGLLSASHQQANFNALWARVKASGVKPLSDADIVRVLLTGQETTLGVVEGVAFLREEQVVMSSFTYLSSYDIHYLLLHGLDVKPSEWTSVFKQTLQALCLWLLAPISAEDNASLQALKRAHHPFWLLTNMLMLSYLSAESIGSIINWGDWARYAFCYKSALRTSFIPDLLPHLNTLIQNSYQLRSFLQLADSAQRAQVWTVVENCLPTLIQDNDHLLALLSLSFEQLNAAQRAQVWTVVENCLPTLIQDNDYLIAFLSLSLEQLNAAQRTQIWAAVENRLSTFIDDGRQLLALLKLSPEQLNAAQRAQILIVLQNHSLTLIQNGYQLKNLLQLSAEQLNPEQRAQVWAAVENRLSSFIDDGYQLLALLKLSPEQLNAAQRAQVWAAVENRLSSFIDDGYALIGFLELSAEQLNAAQRARVWAIVENYLFTFIDDGHQLLALLRLSIEQLDEMQRMQLLSTVLQYRPSRPQLIRSYEQLIALLKLSSEQLDTWQRMQLLTVLQYRSPAPQLIQNCEQLIMLLKLSPEQLDVGHRAQVWAAVKNRLSALIQNHDHLIALLVLSLEELNAAQREHVWAVVENRLPTLIENSHQLNIFLALSPEQLNETQRRQILMILEDRHHTSSSNSASSSGLGFGSALFRQVPASLASLDLKDVSSDITMFFQNDL